MIRIIQGDALEKLKGLPAGSVHMCVTSPPYWGLRNYGVAGQLGLEKTPEEYVEKMVEIFRGVKRVLRDDGTLWLNMGDCYATGAGKVGKCPGGSAQGEKFKSHFGKSTPGSVPAMQGLTQPNRMPIPGLKPKDLVGMPWRVAFALQADGWWLRSDVIEEVEIYCPHCGWMLEERIWRHGQDREIIWSKPNPIPESVTDRPTKSHEYIFLLSKSRKYYYNAESIREPADWLANNGPGAGVGWDKAGTVAPHDPRKTRKRIKMPNGWDTSKGKGGHGNYHKNGKGKGRYSRPKDMGRKQPVQDDRTRHDQCVNGHNKHTVWTVTTKSFHEAHFATFPPDLIRPCILAGCPQGGTVLDPFLGAGTTGLVANQEGLDCIGFDLSPEYCDMAEKRIKDECPLFTEIIRE